MRFFTNLLLAGCCLLASTLSAQFFTDSVRLSTQPEAGAFSFIYLQPTGQTGPDDPLLIYGYDGDPILVYGAEGNTFRFDTLETEVYLSENTRYEDFNGDGFTDIVTLFGRVHFGTADGSFENFSDRGFRAVYDFADWNGDGLNDGFGHKQSGVFEADGEVYLLTALPDSNAFVVDTVDTALKDEGAGQFAFINGDTLVDFCYLGGNFPDNQLICLLNDGAGGYTKESRGSDTREDALILADFNGDGFDDAATPQSFGGINITYNNNGTFLGASTTLVYNGGTEEYKMGPGGAADIDGDGDQDLIVTLNPFASSEYYIGYLLNNGDGFDAPVIITQFPGSDRNDRFNIEYAIRRVRLMDLNGDDRKDILFNSNWTQTTYVFFSTLPPVSAGEALPSATKVKVYPNPIAGDILHVEFPPKARPVNVVAFAADGRSVAMPNITGDGTLAVGHLPVGLYTLVITDSEDRLYQARFLRQ